MNLEKDGVTTYGLIGDATEKTNMLIPLDGSPASRKFRAELERLISAAQ